MKHAYQARPFRPVLPLVLGCWMLLSSAGCRQAGHADNWLRDEGVDSGRLTRLQGLPGPGRVEWSPDLAPGGTSVRIDQFRRIERTVRVDLVVTTRGHVSRVAPGEDAIGRWRRDLPQRLLVRLAGVPTSPETRSIWETMIGMEMRVDAFTLDAWTPESPFVGVANSVESACHRVSFVGTLARTPERPLCVRLPESLYWLTIPPGVRVSPIKWPPIELDPRCVEERGVDFDAPDRGTGRSG